MGLENDLDELKDELDNEADALEAQLESWEAVFPAYLFNWISGVINMKVSEKRAVVSRINALLAE